MYDNHVPIIASAMRRDRNTFVRGIMFAILSMRVQFPLVPDQCTELARRGAKAKCLWGHKYGAYVYVTDHADTLWRDCCAATTAQECIMILCRIPGLGIVKSAFVAQMLGHDIPCIDSRNQAREGISPNAWKPRKANKGTFPTRVARYCDHYAGRARELWDTWCDEVARVYLLGSGEHVSAMHVRAIVPPKLRKPRLNTVTLADTF